MISIITITYNNIDGLKKTVQSVLEQTELQNIEYIIIDGASTDGTVEFLEKLPLSVKWISEKDRGISHAFNKGVKISTGDYILCLNAGDSFINDKVIKKVLPYLIDTKIVSFKVKVQDELFIPRIDDASAVWEKCDEPHQGTFVARSVYDEVGGYCEEFKIRMDYDFFARCHAKEYSFQYIPEVIVEYEPGGVSMQKDNRVRFWREGMAIKYLYRLKISYKDVIKTIIFFNKLGE